MGKYNEALEESRNRKLLPAGKHDVVIEAAEIKLGEDARPSWATKSVSFRFANEEGSMFWDCELDPLTKSDGEENGMSVQIGMGNLENMGLDWGEVENIADYAREAEAFVMAGGPLGAKVKINVIEKQGAERPDDKGGGFYTNRNVYVNELLEAGAGDTSTSAEAEPATF